MAAHIDFGMPDLDEEIYMAIAVCTTTTVRNVAMLAILGIASVLPFGAGAAVPEPAGAPPHIAVQVLSGGVGEGARERLSEQAADFGLKLVFTLSTGSFIADVAFEVLRGGDVIIKDVSKGPWAFVKLAPGNYTVRATYAGLTQTRKVNVPKKGQRRLPFSWPAPPRITEQPK
jgi:hypothetical protein